MGDAEFTRKTINDFHRFFHQPLRAGDLFLEAAGVERGFFFQRQLI